MARMVATILQLENENELPPAAPAAAGPPVVPPPAPAAAPATALAAASPLAPAAAGLPSPPPLPAFRSVATPLRAPSRAAANLNVETPTLVKELSPTQQVTVGMDGYEQEALIGESASPEVAQIQSEVIGGLEPGESTGDVTFEDSMVSVDDDGAGSDSELRAKLKAQIAARPRTGAHAPFRAASGGAGRKRGGEGAPVASLVSRTISKLTGPRPAAAAIAQDDKEDNGK